MHRCEDGGVQELKRLGVSGRDVPWMLRTRAERRPDKPFLIWEPFVGQATTWTYAEFAADVKRVAGGLRRLGVAFGDRVMIHLENCPEFMLAWFACADVGAIAVSTNTAAVARDMEFYAEHTTPVVAITSPSFVSLLADAAPMLVVTSTDAGEPADPPVGPGISSFDDLLAGEPDPDLAPSRPVDPMADLGIQFTSGTTSRPKAVLWTHANVVWASEVSVSHMRLRSDDITLVFLPLFHTNAQAYSMLSTLWSGGTMILQPRFSASRFWDVSLRYGVTWCSMIPFCVKALLSIPTPDEHQYRFWNPAIRFSEVDDAIGAPAFGWWGMTETVAQGIVSSFDHLEPRMSIGRPSPAFDISIRRPDGFPIEAGERGELFIRGERGVQLFKEYYLNPEATSDAFDDDGWFATGDLILMDDDGNLFFSDRTKDMLKVGAENVAASEIEMVILESGLASECAVVAQLHEMLDEVPVAFVIPAPDAPDAPGDVIEGILAACRRDLAKFKVPRAVYLVDDLPRSTLEKIAKNVLRQGLPTLND